MELILRLHSKTLGHMDDLIAVRMEASGSRYDGIEHWVSRSLVDNVGRGKVVWWPRRAKGKPCRGYLVKQEEQEGDYFLQNKYGITCTPGLGMDDAQDQDSAAAVQSASAGVASARKGKSEGIMY